MAKRINQSGTLFSFSFTKTPAKKSRNDNEEDESTGTKEVVDVDRHQSDRDVVEEEPST